jgi:hypothetical protein
LGGPIEPTLLLKIASNLPRTANVLLFSLYGAGSAVLPRGPAARGFRTLLFLSARGARSPLI